MAVGFWLVAIAPSYAMFLLLGAFIGAGRSGTMLVNQSLMMGNTKPEYFGRVMSFAMMAFGFQALFGPVWGGIADAIGGLETMALIGVIAAGATVFMLFGWLRTRKLPLEAGTAAASMRRRGVSIERPASEVPAIANGRNGALGANGPGSVQPTFASQLARVALMDPQKPHKERPAQGYEQVAVWDRQLADRVIPDAVPTPNTQIARLLKIDRFLPRWR